uniref:Putative secreted protein n=1 Tax=Anopheles darlingi TaxID=43151 RepID=A0A2M4DHP3_ANODA
MALVFVLEKVRFLVAQTHLVAAVAIPVQHVADGERFAHHQRGRRFGSVLDGAHHTVITLGRFHTQVT